MDKLLTINAHGTKSITLDQFPPEAWSFISGDPDGDSSSVKALWAAVPWLYQGVNVISQSCGEIPLSLYRGETEVTSSEDWNDVTGYLPDISKLLRKISASVVLEGQGYLFRDTVQGYNATKRLIFWSPTTVTVNSRKTKETRKLYFDRRVNGKVDTYSSDEVIYFWPDDGYTEVGPPASSPAKAALAAAGVLYNADKYVSAYWDRGAVKAMMLAVKGNPPQSEKDKLSDWWKSITGGVKKAFSVFTLNADTVTPTVVGDGLEGLQNTALTVEKREDISTALGVPQSILFSNSAGGLGGAGVVTQDQVKFYEMTVIPLVKLICGALNEQQLGKQGYRLVVNENEMAMYQEDESARANVVSTISGALDNPEKFLLAADIAGMELDEEVRARIEAMIARKQERAAELVQQMQPAAQPVPAAPTPAPEQTPPPDDMMSAKALDDIARWRRKAIRAGGVVEFKSDFIPADVVTLIADRLKVAVSPDEIKAAFVLDHELEVDSNTRAIETLADSIRLAVSASKGINEPTA